MNTEPESADVEQDLQFFSDLYKDRHGFRPRFMYERFRQMSETECRDEIETLSKMKPLDE